MNSPATTRTKQAFTLIELLVVLAIIVMVVMFSLPMLADRGSRPTQVLCMNNLKQIGLGFWLYSEDHSNQPPWQVSLPEGSGAANFF